MAGGLWAGGPQALQAAKAEVAGLGTNDRTLALDLIAVAKKLAS